MTRRYHVVAFTAGGRHVASETVEADASDTALHQMLDRYPKAQRCAAVPAPRVVCPGWAGTHPEPIVLHDGPSPDSHGMCPACAQAMDAAEPQVTGQTIREYCTNHEGVEDEIPSWEYHRYLVAVRDFMRLRAEGGESPSQTLGVRNGAWAHQLLDRLLEMMDDPARCRRETKRLEDAIAETRRLSPQEDAVAGDDSLERGGADEWEDYR